MLYFAYGANMDEETLAERGVRYETVCTGKIRHVRLAFSKPGDDGTGKADLQNQRGGVVEGVVYEVPEESLARLDVYEGIDRGHYRREVVTVQTARGEIDCVAYRATKFRTGLKPSKAYLQALVRGAETHRLSAGYGTFLRSHGTADG